MSTVAQREEPLLLQAVDEPRTLSIFLPRLLAHNTRACPHVPHRCPVARGQTGSRLKLKAEVCWVFCLFVLAKTAFLLSSVNHKVWLKH